MATATKPRSSTKIRPLGEKVLIKRAEPREQTEAGIYLPESAKDKPKEGTVVAVGDGKLNRETGETIPMTVKAGDRVIFTSYAGTDISIDDDEYLIMTEDDILGIID